MIKKHSKSKLIENTLAYTPKYIEVNRIAAYFFCVLLLVTTFFSGFAFGKKAVIIGAVPSAPAAVPTVAPAQAQAGAQAQPASKISQDVIKSLFAKNVVKFGNGDKKLLIVEISDPSCPYCQVAGGNTDLGSQMGAQFNAVSKGGTYVPPVPEIKKLVDQGKADFVWIYNRGHGNGELATKALYCAFDQGKFWQAHDLLTSAKGYDLMNNQIHNDVSKSQTLIDFLASAIDTGKLKSCLDSGKYDSIISDNSAIAATLGVNGTPGFFLNTANFAGAYSWTEMKASADSAQ